MNYTDLEQAIQDYTKNSETAFVSHINDFIKSAEDKVFMAVKGALFWRLEDSGTFTTGVGQEVLATGGSDILDFYVVGTSSSLPGQSLQRVDHSFIREAYPRYSGMSVAGFPKYYALVKSNLVSNEQAITVEVVPIPDSDYGYKVSYNSKLTTDSITSGNTPGTSSTDETWISVVYPDLLLQGSLMNAYIYMKGNQAEVDRYEKSFNQGLMLLKNLAEGRQETDNTTQLGEAEKGM